MVNIQKVTQVQSGGNSLSVSSSGDSVRVEINGKVYTQDGPVESKFKTNPVISVVESLTFLIYTFFIITVFGVGMAYLIFYKGISPWYGLISLIALEEFAFTPKQWSSMFNQTRYK